MLSRSGRTVLFAVVVVVAVVGVLLALAFVPVGQSFSMRGAAIYDADSDCTGIATTAGTSVAFHWSADAPVYFFAVSCAGHGVAYQGNGSGGSGAFVSAGGVYELGASCPEGPCVGADVAGTFTGPLLPL